MSAESAGAVTLVATCGEASVKEGREYPGWRQPVNMEKKGAVVQEAVTE